MSDQQQLTPTQLAAIKFRDAKVAWLQTLYNKRDRIDEAIRLQYAKVEAANDILRKLNLISK